ncbi:MAG: dihydrofolate reductase [Lewinella sp.]|nr:dihydrofolate reductase [Lewinella sp.]
MIALIAAMDLHRLIGAGNRLPWHLPADWAHFQAVTDGKPFIMGRKSYQAVDALISSYRNIILTSKAELPTEAHTALAGSLEEALAMLADEPEVFILGGASVFEQALPMADYLYLTIVHGFFEGDAYFPKVDWTEWTLVRSRRHYADAENSHTMALNEYQRRKR